MSTYDRILQRIESLIVEANRLHPLQITEPSKGLRSWMWTEHQVRFFKWIHSSLNIINIMTGSGSSFYDSFPKEPVAQDMGHIRYMISMGIAILSSLKEELENGFINRIENLISADILETINDHAEALLESGYKDGAAIYGRVMIETALKKICDSKSIEYPINATIGKLSQVLRKEDVLNLIEWRRVSSWADIGNAAAHGRFDEYSLEDVELMLQGIKTFVSNKLA